MMVIYEEIYQYMIEVPDHIADQGDAAITAYAIQKTMDEEVPSDLTGCEVIWKSS